MKWEIVQNSSFLHCGNYSKSLLKTSFMLHMEIHRKMWSEQLMASYRSAVHFSPLFQQPVKIILLAASKNSECSLKENDKYFFPQTVYGDKCLGITDAKRLYCSCVLPT